MASSSDAVRNFVYDVHLHDLRQGWNIVQELEAQELDSWEKIFAKYPVKDLSEQQSWDDSDERRINAFSKECPLLGDKLAAQLAAQASLFVRSPYPRALRRGHSIRLGSLRERINRLYLSEKLPAVLGKSMASSKHIKLGLRRSGPKLVPFAEAVGYPEFTA